MFLDYLRCLALYIQCNFLALILRCSVLMVFRACVGVGISCFYRRNEVVVGLILSRWGLWLERVARMYLRRSIFAKLL